MSLIKILTVLFVIFAGSRVILRFHDKAIGYMSFFFWSGVWTAVLLVVFRPTLADRVATLFGISQGVNAMFFFAIILIFYLLFRLYIKLDNLDQLITQLNTKTSEKITLLEAATRKEKI